MKHVDDVHADLVARWSSCERCSLCRGRRNVVVGEHARFTDSETGPVDSPLVLVVGEAPGRHEDVQGRPMIGPAGTMVREILVLAGVREMYLTNACACRPPESAAPGIDALAACRPRLAVLLDELHPALVVTIGRVAEVAFEEPFERRGAPVVVDAPRVSIVHPAAWLHQQLPSAVVERRKKEAAKAIEKALPKLPAPCAEEPVEPACEHDAGVVGRWVNRMGQTVEKIVACRKCGKVVA